MTSINYIRLRIVGILKPKLYPRYLKIFNNTHLANNELILFCGYSDFDVPIGHNFTQIKDREGSSYPGTIEFKYATNDFLLPYETITKGFKTICKFQFSDETQLSIVKKLPFISDWYESDEYLFFESL